MRSRDVVVSMASSWRDRKPTALPNSSSQVRHRAPDDEGIPGGRAWMQAEA